MGNFLNTTHSIPGGSRWSLIFRKFNIDRLRIWLVTDLKPDTLLYAQLSNFRHGGCHRKPRMAHATKITATLAGKGLQRLPKKIRRALTPFACHLRL
jgi:hypothetical protein